MKNPVSAVISRPTAKNPNPTNSPPLHNSFSILEDNENELLDNEIQVQRDQSVVKKLRIPPIVQMNKSSVIDVLLKHGVTNYYIKLASIGMYL